MATKPKKADPVIRIPDRKLHAWWRAHCPGREMGVETARLIRAERERVAGQELARVAEEQGNG